MLYLIGLGLSSIEDITLRGLNIVKKCDHVFIESYTSILSHGVEEIEKLTGKNVKKADRECVEQTNTIITLAKDSDVAFLVVGDPLTATTHLDLLLRCLESTIPVKVIHNASILNAVGCCGLQLYEYGETVSVPFWDELGNPESFYDKIEHNFKRGLHTLCLLDIKVKEKSVENIIKQREIFEPPRYMTCRQAADQLLRIISRRTLAQTEIPPSDAILPISITPPAPVITTDCLVIGLARVGSDDRVVAVSTLSEMARGQSNLEGDGNHISNGDLTPLSQLLNGPLHSLVIPGRLQPLEIDWLLARDRFPLQNHQLPVVSAAGVKADALPYVFVSVKDNEAATANEIEDNCNDSKERRRRAVEAMFDKHCKTAVHAVTGELS